MQFTKPIGYDFKVVESDGEVSDSGPLGTADLPVPDDAFFADLRMIPAAKD